MPVDAHSHDLTLGLVGTGAMGRGIAQIAVQAGIRTLLYDTQPGAAAAARDSVAATLAKLAEKGKVGAAEAAAATGRLEVVNHLDQLHPCAVVVEAIVENLEVKRQLFRQLEDIVGTACLLATNTSSLSVTAIAAGCRQPERVGGFHFFNPVPLMRIVEVIDGLLTAPWVSETLLALGRRMGHTAVLAKDTPGFIVNHAGRGFVTEALRLLGENVAEFADIDRVMRDAAGFRMGPFELLDLTGLDVSHPVMESIYRQYYEEPRYRPSPLAAQRLTAGVLGRKTGRGFYAYPDGKISQPAENPPPSERPARVWISQAIPEFAARVGALATAAGVAIDTDQRPQADALCVVTPLGRDASSHCAAEGLDPVRTVAVDCLFGLERRRTIAATPVTGPYWRMVALGLFTADGTPATLIRDSAGLVAQRIVATIVNIGCEIAQQGIASPDDIDRAVTLGLGYPKGPLAFGDALGPRRILAVLEAMQGFYGDPRYRPSPWLKRRAMLGLSLLANEA